MFSFQNTWPIKRKAVYTLVLFQVYLFIFGSDHNFSFLKKYLLFKFESTCKQLQVVRSVVSGGKFYQLLPDKEKTVLWILKILLTKIYLRSMISFLLFSNQVYKAALLLLFMGVPLLRCWERWLWFSPVHSTTSRCGILCCCMYILITFAACHGSILAKKQKQLMKKQPQLNRYFWSHPYHTDTTIMGSLLLFW